MSIEIKELTVKAQPSQPVDELSVERNELALERTHLAWIRTLFTLITSGIAIDKGLKIVHEQRLLSSSLLVESGHVIGIIMTAVGTIILMCETIQYVKRSRQLALMKKGKHRMITTTFALSLFVTIFGFSLIFLMLRTG